MIFSSAALAGCHRYHHYHHHSCGNGWGIAAAGVVGGLIIGALANSAREERRQDPGEYRQDPGEYRQDPGITPVRPRRLGAVRDVELAEKVQGGVIINGQFYAPAVRTADTGYAPRNNTAPYTDSSYGNYSSFSEMFSSPVRQDPGRQTGN